MAVGQITSDWSAAPGTVGAQQGAASSAPGTVGVVAAHEPLPQYATGTLTFGSSVSSGTLTIGSVTLTFEPDGGAPVDELSLYVPVALSPEEAAAAVVEVIHVGIGIGGPYAGWQVSASSLGAVVTVTATAPGTAGNSLASTTTVAGASWGGSVLSGGVDAPGSPGTVGAIV